ncbi:MAG: putative toxin-antitoxin system toxin component, PIN family [Planctomycetes bacterium]|nr:putative toxin-antitoxin system toxin component, PIN family [Planctomycetota bacterium]
MIVTIDTNIIYQSIRSSSGASHKIVQMVRHGEIRLALSNAVLLRQSSLEAFKLSNDDVLKVLRLIAFVSDKFAPSFLFRPNLKDEDDNIFVELAVVSQSNYLITNNLKDYRNSELKFNCFKVITPSDFLRKWRK